MLAHVAHKMLHTVRHAQRFNQSLMIGKSHRDASLVHVKSGKYIVVTRYKCLASHRSASLIQWLKFQPLYRLLSTRGEPRHPSYKSQTLWREHGVDRRSAWGSFYSCES